MSSPLMAICKREWFSYIQTPVAYVFGIVFLLAQGAFTFYLSGYFERGVADMQPFFQWHPWLYLFLVPAVSMRLWSEERRSGTIELIMTLPVSLWDIVIGKFLAGWLFLVMVLCGTLPLWFTANYLGNPDNGAIATGYLASALMAGAYMAIGSAISAMTRNQVIAFIVSAAVSLIFVMAGYSLVIQWVEGWMPQFLVQTIASLSFMTHFETMSRGVIQATSLIYFGSMIMFWLFITYIVVEQRRGR
jgi:ABC-2 type transport system permease protein